MSQIAQPAPPSSTKHAVGRATSQQRAHGIRSALASALFLGMAPVFGKQAIRMGLPWEAVVGLRTTFAALLLLTVILLFKRRYFYIYPAGLLGCLLAGGINGIGSLLYYSALERIDAGLGQLLYALYPLFVALWLRLDHQPLQRLTVFRLTLTLPALYLLTQTGHQQIDLLGAGMMLASSALYALHLPINQHVLYDMPAPTVTLYTLIAMSIVVLPAFFVSAPWTWPVSTAGSASIIHSPTLSSWIASIPALAWISLLGLTIVTFLSRITLFLGVKHLGGLQTALLGLSEVLVTVIGAHLWLGERFTPLQWAGMLLLLVSLSLVGLEKTPPRKYTAGGWLNWLRPPGLPDDIPWPHD